MAHASYLKAIHQKIEKPDFRKYNKAVFILHDQLNLKGWPHWVSEEKPVLIFIEAEAKGQALPYHKKKVTYVLSSMRHFALECSLKGFPVLYHSTSGHYDDGVREILDEFQSLHISYMKPSEWETRQMLRTIKNGYSNRVTELQNSFFIAETGQWIDNIGPGYRMEYFYREMRRKTGYLVADDQPEGGEWNYDDQNREALPADIDIPEIKRFKPDAITQEVMEMVETIGIESFGLIDDFGYAVTRKDALQLLDEFIDERALG